MVLGEKRMSEKECKGDLDAGLYVALEVGQKGLTISRHDGEELARWTVEVRVRMGSRSCDS